MNTKHNIYNYKINYESYLDVYNLWNENANTLS